MDLQKKVEIFDFSIDRSKRRKWATGNFLDKDSPFFSEYTEINVGSRNSKSQPDTLHFHHKTQEFYLVISGRLTLQVDNQEIDLQPLQLLAIPPTIPHAVIKATDNTKFVAIKSPSGLNDKVIVL
ncbi:MAG: cupin domain-containing protein [Patescibacteria group bacterium]|nr:cupin domain-containing protein [Patescibacteria group bacterium]